MITGFDKENKFIFTLLAYELLTSHIVYGVLINNYFMSVQFDILYVSNLKIKLV